MPESLTRRGSAAKRAWLTRRSAPYRAARAENRSKLALAAWAEARGFRLILLDGPSGRPRTGIVDALLVRHRRADADSFEIYAVQLKGGGAGMTPREMTRLAAAATRVCAEPLVVLHDADRLHFLPAEPKSERRQIRRAKAD